MLGALPWGSGGYYLVQEQETMDPILLLSKELNKIA
jgi:hypothetical protein